AICAWRVCVAFSTSYRGFERASLSSLRTQGPIPRDLHYREESSCSARATNCGLWLWVPACAGTTEGRVGAQFDCRGRQRRVCAVPAVHQRGTMVGTLALCPPYQPLTQAACSAITFFTAGRSAMRLRWSATFGKPARSTLSPSSQSAIV